MSNCKCPTRPGTSDVVHHENCKVYPPHRFEQRVTRERCPQFHFQYRCDREAGHLSAVHRTMGDDGTLYAWCDNVAGQDVANKTWRRGFVHLTVDGDGLVSLWDERREESSYLRLNLTPEQIGDIEDARMRGGITP